MEKKKVTRVIREKHQEISRSTDRLPKVCTYCKLNRSAGSGRMWIAVQGDSLKVSAGSDSAEFRISYCPFCGEKLLREKKLENDRLPGQITIDELTESDKSGGISL